MRFLFIFLITAIASTGWSKDVKDFNKELIKNVQKDIQTDNDDEFKVKTKVKREPASAAPVEEEPILKQEKLNQVGPAKW